MEHMCVPDITAFAKGTIRNFDPRLETLRFCFACLFVSHLLAHPSTAHELRFAGERGYQWSFWFRVDASSGDFLGGAARALPTHWVLRSFPEFRNESYSPLSLPTRHTCCPTLQRCGNDARPTWFSL